MVRGLDSTFWGTKFCEVLAENPENLEKIGLSDEQHKRNIQQAKDQEAEQVYVTKHVDVEDCNARQAFQRIKGGDIKYEFAEVEHCMEVAPVNINVYTDGSYLHNRRVYFSLCGAGVWWPGRDLDEDPLTNAEYEMACGTQTKKGYALRTALAGHGGSSTRAEIAAGILACQAKKAVNVGSDSQAFVTKANEVADMVKRGKGPKKP